MNYNDPYHEGGEARQLWDEACRAAQDFAVFARHDAQQVLPRQLLRAAPTFTAGSQHHKVYSVHSSMIEEQEESNSATFACDPCHRVVQKSPLKGQQ